MGEAKIGTTGPRHRSRVRGQDRAPRDPAAGSLLSRSLRGEARAAARVPQLRARKYYQARTGAVREDARRDARARRRAAADGRRRRRAAAGRARARRVAAVRRRAGRAARHRSRHLSVRDLVELPRRRRGARRGRRARNFSTTCSASSRPTRRAWAPARSRPSSPTTSARGSRSAATNSARSPAGRGAAAGSTFAALQRSLQLNGVDRHLHHQARRAGRPARDPALHRLHGARPAGRAPAVGRRRRRRMRARLRDAAGLEREHCRREILRRAAARTRARTSSGSRRSPACRSRWSRPARTATRRSCCITRSTNARPPHEGESHAEPARELGPVQHARRAARAHRLRVRLRVRPDHLHRARRHARRRRAVADLRAAARDPVDAFVRGRGRHDPRRARHRRAHDDDDAAPGRDACCSSTTWSIPVTRSRRCEAELPKRFPHIRMLKTAVLWWKACSMIKPDYLRRVPPRQSVDPPAVRGLRHAAAGRAPRAARSRRAYCARGDAPAQRLFLIRLRFRARRLLAPAVGARLGRSAYAPRGQRDDEGEG